MYEPLVRVMDHAEAMRFCTQAKLREAFAKREQFQVEPVSPLFADYAVVTFNGSTKPGDPLNSKASCTATAVLNADAIEVLDWIKDNLGPDALTGMARSGAVYSNLAFKRLAKAVRNPELLMERRQQLYEGPYAAAVPEKLRLLFSEYYNLSLRNIQKFIHNPDLLLVGKPGATGTGYADFRTRDDMVKAVKNGNGQAVAETLKANIACFYEQIIHMCSIWPKHAAMGYTPEYKGIRGGARSDADVIAIEDTSSETFPVVTATGASGVVTVPPCKYGRWTIEAGTREVTNDPASVINSHGLTTASEQSAILSKYMSEYHIHPSDIVTSIHVFSTPPATVPWTDGSDYRLLSVDFGPCEFPAYVQDNRLVIPDPGFSGGAEQLFTQGMFMRARDGHMFEYWASGIPPTMAGYLIGAGEPIAQWARVHNIPTSALRILEVGDDLHIWIQAKYISLLMAEMGGFLKAKGMKQYGDWHVNFILGHYYCFLPKEDGTFRLVTLVMPRVLKTVTSASQIGKNVVPDQVKKGVNYLIVPSDEARAATQEYRQLFGSLLFFDGTPESWIHECLYGAKFARMKIAQTEMDPGNGYAMALQDLGLDDAMADQMAADYIQDVQPVMTSNEPDSAPTEDVPVGNFHEQQDSDKLDVLETSSINEQEAEPSPADDMLDSKSDESTVTVELTDDDSEHPNADSEVQTEEPQEDGVSKEESDSVTEKGRGRNEAQAVTEIH